MTITPEVRWTNEANASEFLSFTPDESALFCGTTDGIIGWNTIGGENLKTPDFSREHVIAWSSNGRSLATVRIPENSGLIDSQGREEHPPRISIWSVEENKKLSELESRLRLPFREMKFSPSGKELAVVYGNWQAGEGYEVCNWCLDILSSDSGALIWTTDSQWHPVRLVGFDRNSEILSYVQRELSGHQGRPIEYQLFSLLMNTGKKTPVMKISDKDCLHGGAGAWSRETGYFITSPGEAVIAWDPKVQGKVWEYFLPNELGVASRGGIGGLIPLMSLSTDGRLLALLTESIYNDSSWLVFLDATCGKQLLHWKATSFIFPECVTLSSTGRYVAVTYGAQSRSKYLNRIALISTAA